MEGKSRRLQKIIYALTAFNAVCLLFIYMAGTLVAERCWLTIVLGYVPQQAYGIPTALLLVWSLIQKRWWLAALNITAAVFFIVLLMGFNVPHSDAHRQTGRTVRVMTYNIHHASQGVPLIINDIKRMHADIVCLQETNQMKLWHDPMPEIERRLPGWHSTAVGQLAIVSRYPIKDKYFYRSGDDTWRGFILANVVVKDRELCVVDVHLTKAASIHEITRHHDSIAPFLDCTTALRSRQISDIMEMASELKRPFVVAGDFNTPPRGRLYRRMVRRFSDAFHARGWGFGYSYRSDLPIMRIDYIFTTPGIHPLKCAAPALSGSDHRPVVADLDITRRSSSHHYPWDGIKPAQRDVNIKWYPAEETEKWANRGRIEDER